jgi:hypothetical protein
MAVIGVGVFDLLSPLQATAGRGGELPTIVGVQYDPRDTKVLRDSKPRVAVEFHKENDRFGINQVDPADPNNHSKWKRLTFREDGASNNTIIKINGTEHTFGFKTRSNVFLRPRLKALPKPYLGWSTAMRFRDEEIQVTQSTQIIPGPTLLLDTVLIWYKVENYGKNKQKVGVRILLDTFIGQNDGVPFTVPGSSGFVRTKADYSGARIPDYVEAVEKPENDRDPGTIVRLGLTGVQWSDTIKLVEPSRVRISRFPGEHIKWDWNAEDIGNDSSIAVFWDEEEIAPKGTRNFAITYGLGKLDIKDQIALSVPEKAIPNGEFVVTAYIYNAHKGDKVRLQLPPGVILNSGTEQITLEENAKRTQVYWRVKAGSEGTVTFHAVIGKTKSHPVSVKIQAKSILG